MSNYRIIGMPKSRLIRVSWMLEELGQEYTIESAAPHSNELKKFNPSGKGPVLVDEAGKTPVIVIDSAAICLYLADRHPEMNMTAAPGTPQRAALDSWLHFAQSDLEAPLWLKARHKFILPKDMRLDVGAVTAFDFDRAVETMDARLGDNEFALGDQFSPADILLGHCGYWAHQAKFTVQSERVSAYFNRVLSRRALARGRKKEANLGSSGNL